MSLTDFYSFQFNDFVFGANTPYVITEVSGLEDLPTIRNQDDFKGYNDGMFTGRDFYGGRTLTFMLKIFAGNGNSAQQNLNLFQQALNPQQTGTSPLVFQLSPNDSNKVINARVRTRAVKIDPEYTYGYITAQITLFCPDPRYYDTNGIVVSLSPSGGSWRTYNRTYDIVYGGGYQTGSATATNSGWSNADPIVTITGPAQNPVVGNRTTNQAITLNYTLSSSDVVVLDLNQKTVLLNGSNARNILANNSQWWTLEPGNQTVYFTATSWTNGVTTCTISFASSYV